jgi:exonuclease SbcC
MQILKLELENIKSYTKDEVTFTEGVNAIVGHNGAGKSTILEAIGFVLFDKLAYTAGEFLREGARTGTAAVTFQSSYDERIYRVERRLGGSHLYAVFDPELGAKLCEGKLDVLAFVRRHSGADPSADLGRLFGDAVGVAQGTLTAIFLQTPTVRKSAFDTLLQVDEYKNAFDRLLEPRNLLRERQREVTEQIAVLAARLERLPQLEVTAAQVAADHAQAEERRAATEERLATLQARRQLLEEARTAIEELERRQTQLRDRGQTLSGQLTTSERTLATALEAQALVTANQAGYEQYVAAQASKNELDEQLRQRQKWLAAHAAADKALALCEAEQKRLEVALAAVASAERAVDELAPAVARQEELEKAFAEIQHAVRSLADAEQQTSQQAQRIAQLEARQVQLRAQLAQAAAVRASIDQLEQQETEGSQALSQQSHELATFKVEAETLKRQITALQEVATTQCPVCEQPLTDEHRRRMMARNEQRLASLRATYASVQEATRQLEASAKARAERLKRLRDELHHLPRAGELEEVDRTYAEAAERLATLQGAVSRFVDAPEQSRQLEAELKRLDNPRQRRAIQAQQASQRATHETELAGILERRQAAEQQLSAAEAALKAFANLDVTAAEVNAALVKHEPAYKTVLGRRQQAESAAQWQAEVERLRRDHAQAEVALAETEREIAGALGKFDPAEYRGILSEEQALRGEQGALRSRIELLQAEAARIDTELATLRCLQVEKTALEAQQQGLATQEAALDAVRQFLRQSGPYVTQAVIRQISAGAAQIFSELMQDYSRQLAWSEDYGISLDVDGVTRQFAQLSGGEQMSAALAVRLALVREMSNIDIAFFDEPTANLDDVRREALARQIMNVKGFRQLFVISHDDTFEQATQNLIRVNRYGSTSKIASATIE